MSLRSAKPAREWLEYHGQHALNANRIQTQANQTKIQSNSSACEWLNDAAPEEENACGHRFAELESVRE